MATQSCGCCHSNVPPFYWYFTYGGDGLKRIDVQKMMEKSLTTLSEELGLKTDKEGNLKRLDETYVEFQDLALNYDTTSSETIREERLGNIVYNQDNMGNETFDAIHPVDSFTDSEILKIWNDVTEED